MASTFSTNLAIELIGTGDQAGTWGVTTNTNLGTLVEQAISGYVTQAVSTGSDTTITIPNGATGVARNMYIELTGTGGTNTNLIVPSNKKLYFIFNNTSSGQVTVKVSGQTGVSVPNGKKVVLVCNGTDIVNGLNYIADFGTNSFTVTNLTATSATITNLIATTASVSDASATVLRSASATITNLIATSASITTLTNNPTFSAGTANGVLYLNASKVATSGSALTFDGTNLSVTRGLKAASAGIVVSSFVDGLSVGGYDSIGFLASPGSALAVGGYRAAQWSAVEFYANGSLQATLNSTGLGIGTTPSGYLANKVVISTGTDSNNGITIASATNRNGSIWFADGTTGDQAYRGGVDYQHTIDTLYLYSGGQGNFQLTSSGNLGLGVTPSAWSGSYYKAIEGGDAGNQGAIAFRTDLNGVELFANSYFDGTNNIYKFTGAASLYQNTNGVHSWSTAPSGTAGNAITFTQALTLNANGALILQGGDTGANGIGVTFPASQSASTNANTLDDYEEGTWTPTDNSGAGLTFTVNGAQYTKIGRTVTVNFEFSFPSTANGNNVSVSLPFTPDSANRGGLSAFSNRAGETNIYILNSANFNLYDDTGNQLTNANMSTKYLIVSITYFV